MLDDRKALLEHAAQDKHLAPEEAVLDATIALDALVRKTVMREREGLSKVQTDIVMSLMLFGASSMTELSQRLAVSKEHISRAVGGLVQKGYVSKHRSEENFRVVAACLTDAGMELSNTIRLASLEALQNSLAALSSDEREELVSLTQRCAQILFKLDIA